MEQTRSKLQLALNAFASQVAEKEGLKSQVHYGNILEMLRVQNEILEGQLYHMIQQWFNAQNKLR